jgi:predicted transcriptional regulator of viral defense system
MPEDEDSDIWVSTLAARYIISYRSAYDLLIFALLGHAPSILFIEYLARKR